MDGFVETNSSVAVFQTKKSRQQALSTPSKTAALSPHLYGLFKSEEGIHKGRLDSSQAGIPDTQSLLPTLCITFN